MDGNKLRIYDPLKKDSIQLMEVGDLLTRWTGSIICVTDSKPSIFLKARYFATGWFKVVILLLLSVSFVYLVQRFLHTTLSKALGLCVFPLLIGFGLHLVDVSALTRNPFSAFWMTYSQDEAVDFPTISSSELLNILGQDSSDSKLVDARSKSAHAAFTIPGSISISVNSDITNFRLGCSLVRDSKDVIVFCNSRDCNWAKLVARKLHALGVKNVRIFENGMVGYLEEKAARKHSRE